LSSSSRGISEHHARCPATDRAERLHRLCADGRVGIAERARQRGRGRRAADLAERAGGLDLELRILIREPIDHHRHGRERAALAERLRGRDADLLVRVGERLHQVFLGERDVVLAELVHGIEPLLRIIGCEAFGIEVDVARPVERPRVRVGHERADRERETEDQTLHLVEYGSGITASPAGRGPT
jgi:hypothetical protein